LNNETFIKASQDGTAKLWDVSKRKCVATLNHSTTSEVLRVSFVNEHNELVVTCGADGHAKIWRVPIDGSPSAVADYFHGEEQIYACESIGSSSDLKLMTAAGNELRLWDSSGQVCFHRVFTDSIDSTRDGKLAFGGPRNPDEKAFVFDAKMCPFEASMCFGTVGVALSDGTQSLLSFSYAKQITNYVVLNI
jgi:WD40 repeat protein